MSKKYCKFIVTIMFLFTHKTSFSMHSREIQWGNVAVGSALLLVGSVAGECSNNYFGLKKHLHKFQEPPANVQNWIRSELAAQGIKESATVPLRVSDENVLWQVTYGKSILIGKETCDVLSKNLNMCQAGEQKMLNALDQDNELEKARRQIVLDKFMLDHEIKHYKNRDHSKINSLLTFGVVAAPFVMASSLYAFGEADESNVKLLVGGVMGAFICVVKFLQTAFERYCEREADRFALSCVASKEDLAVIKQYWLDLAKDRENILLNEPNKFQIGLIGICAAHLVSKKLNNISQLLQTNINSKQKKLLQKRKDDISSLVEFYFDPYHPSFNDRANMVQEFIDQ